MGLLKDQHPGSTHIRTLGLATAPDVAVFEYAKQHGFVILTKDDDFHFLSILYGMPPQVVRIALGNCTTEQVAQLLVNQHQVLAAFESDETISYLVLG